MRCCINKYGYILAQWLDEAVTRQNASFDETGISFSLLLLTGNNAEHNTVDKPWITLKLNDSTHSIASMSKR
jgi:hypothetical protein